MLNIKFVISCVIFCVGYCCLLTSIYQLHTFTCNCFLAGYCYILAAHQLLAAYWLLTTIYWLFTIFNPSRRVLLSLIFFFREVMLTILTQSLSSDIFTPSCSTSIGTISVAILRAIWFHSIQQEGTVHVLKCSGKGSKN